MARRPKPIAPRPGYEPAMGRPDPAAPAPPATYVTHYPHPSGTVCGVYPTPSNPAHYDPVAPTCPTCAQWFAAATRLTQARYGARPVAPDAQAPQNPTSPPPGEAKDEAIDNAGETDAELEAPP